MKIKTDRGLVLESEEEGVRVKIEAGYDEVNPEFTIVPQGAYLRVLQLKTAPCRYKILIYKSKEDYEKKKKNWLKLHQHDKELLEAANRSEEYWKELK